MTVTPGPPPAPDDPLGAVATDIEALQRADLAGQVAIYERLHATLSSALAGTVEQPGPTEAGR